MQKSKLTLGPVLFNWKPEDWQDFYARIADESDFDVVHVGEVVCSKRSPFYTKLIPDVVERLQNAGKEVVLSSLGLIMNNREIKEAQALAEATSFKVEANDMSVAAMLRGRDFVVGPLVNCYNEGTVAHLESMGAGRICLPAELPADVIAILAKSAKSELEVQAFGRLPLAISARCYHARSRNLSKDGCQYVCADDADGMDVDTLDDEAFLAVNGTQTMSYHYVDLLADLARLQAVGVRAFRLWPQAVDMVAVGRLYRAVLDRKMDAQEAGQALARLCPKADFANGYIHGVEGYRYVDAD